MVEFGSKAEISFGHKLTEQFESSLNSSAAITESKMLKLCANPSPTFVSM